MKIYYLLFYLVSTIVFSGCFFEEDNYERIYEEFHIVEYSATGEIITSKRISEPVLDISNLLVHDNGNYSVIGTIEGKGEKDIFISCYDQSGAKQWTMQHHFDYGDITLDAALSSSNDYLIGGTSRITFDAYSRMYVLQADSKGHVKWKQSERINSCWWETSSLDSTPDDSVIALAYSYELLFLTVSLIKYNENGNKVWRYELLSLDEIDKLKVRSTSDDRYVCLTCSPSSNRSGIYVIQSNGTPEAELNPPRLFALDFAISPDDTIFYAGSENQYSLDTVVITKKTLSDTIIWESSFSPETADNAEHTHDEIFLNTVALSDGGVLVRATLSPSERRTVYGGNLLRYTSDGDLLWNVVLDSAYQFCDLAETPSGTLVAAYKVYVKK